MRRSHSVAIVVASAACFGTLAALTPLAYAGGALPLPLLAWRFLLAALVLGGVSTLRDRRALAVPRADLWRFSLLALTGYGAASVCFFFALRFADASVVAVLLYAYPALVMVTGWVFLKEVVTWQRVAAVAVTFVGCALVVGLLGGQARAAWQGIVLGLGAAVGYASFNLLSHRWLPGRSQATMMTYTFAIAGALAGLLGLLSGQSLAPVWGSRVWWILAVIVFVPTVSAVLLYMQGIRGLGPAQAAVISSLEPLFTMAFAWLLLNERLGAMQIVGGVLVLVGVVIAETRAAV